MYYIIVFFTSVITILPISVLYVIAEAITHIFFLFWTEKRVNTFNNYAVILEYILKRPPSVKEVESLMKRNRINYGRFNAEFLYLPKLAKKNSLPEIYNQQAIDRAVRTGRGLIIGTIHFANWDMAGLAISSHNNNVWAVADDLGGGYSRYIQDTRGKYGINVILPNKNLKDVYRCLENNGILNVLIDRPVPEEDCNGTEVIFFGKKIRVTSFAARLAVKTGACISVGWSVRQDKHFYAEVTDLIQYEMTGNKDKDITNITQLMFNEAEKIIAKYPEQWYMFRKFFLN